MKALFLIIALLGITSVTEAQIIDKLKKALGKDKDLTEADASAGLKEALIQGVTKGTDIVSQVDGYYGNPAIKIPMPDDARQVESTLRKLGMGKQVDEAIESMNRAAEDAASAATPIFIHAIEKMTITDAVGIVQGGDTSGTHYLRGRTTGQLHEAFKPSIKSSLDKVDATKHWKDVMSAYNKVPFVKKVNTDLADYVTGEAINGLFHMIAQEEQNIRTNPAARTTDLLEKVFK
ncbi:MAG: hypothetical protein CL946_04190 [Ectothiorhodospiraceae bacterium]|nr:hypothetical protein [Ectothiorhodospiraceae bacterium]